MIHSWDGYAATIADVTQRIALYDTMEDETSKLVREALFKEYETRTREIEAAVHRYNRIVGFVQTYLTTVSSLATYIYLTQTPFFEAAKKTGANAEVIVGVLAFLTVFLFFLYSAMMDSVYMMNINGARVAAIERIINADTGRDVMIWETKVMPLMMTNQWWVANGSLRPQSLLFFWTSLLFSACICLLTFFCSNYAKAFLGYYAVPAILLAAFHLWQWVQLTARKGNEHIKNSIMSVSGLEDLMNWDRDLWRFLLAPLTVAMGPAVFYVAAIQTGTLLSTPQHQFGLLSQPSVAYGDILILPFLNRKIYDAILVFDQEKGISRSAILVAIVIALLSALCTAYVHYQWTLDEYTGFMDMEIGKLTFAGWWHGFFVSVEVSAIATLAAIGYVGLRDGERKLFASARRAWILVMWFVSFSILDIGARRFCLHVPAIDGAALSPLLIGLTLTLVASVWARRAFGRANNGST